MMRQIIKFLLMLCLFFSVNIPFKVKGENKEKDIRTVTLQLKWKHQFQFAGYYAAIEKGYFQEAGIKVNLLEPDGNQDPNDAVVNGQAEFGISSSDVLLLRSKHKNVVVLASIFQHSPLILLMLEKSNIKHAHDLIGKRISFEANSAEITAYLNEEGVTPDKYISKPPTFDIQQLINGEIDAMSAYSTDETFSLEEANIPYSVISPSMGGLDFYGDVLFTTSDLIEKDPLLVDDFRKAVLKGWRYALNHQDEITELIYNKYSQRHSIKYLTHEADHMKNLIIKDVVEIGYSNPDRWQHILETYQSLNLIDKKQTNKGLLYADYIKHPYNIPWKLIIVFSLAILIIGSVSYSFYRTSRTLRIEIQNRLKIQNELADSEALYRSVLTASPDTIVITDLEGRVRFVSPMVSKMFGYIQADVVNTSMFRYIDRRDQQRAQSRINEMINGNFVGATEYIGLKADGSSFYIEINGAFNLDTEGKPVSIVFVIRDITTRKLAEKKIIKANRFYTFVSQINEAIIRLREKDKLLNEFCRIAIEYGKFQMAWIGMIDPETNIVNPVAFDGYENGYLSKIRQISVSDMPEGQGATGTAIRKGNHFVCDDIENDPRMAVWKNDALERDYHSSIALPIKQFGNVVGAFTLYSSIPYFFDQEEIRLLNEVAANISFAIDAIETDKERKELNAHLELKVNERTTQLADTNEILINEIEERKKAEVEILNAREDAEQANMAKSEFLSRMSHELRTPMNSILGFAQLLQMGELNPGQKKWIEHIMRSGKHLLDLINEVLDISSIEAGRLSLSLEPVQLNGVIQEMMDIVRPAANSRQLTLELVDSTSNQLFVKSDRQRLKQILLNLLYNAIKYNREGGAVLVKNELTTTKHNGIAFVRISISDTGLGIDPQDIPKLYTPFERIGANKSGTEGTGLGLAVVKKLIDAMGGTLGVDSILGEGSTFWIEMPQSESQLASIEKSGLITEPGSGLIHRKGTILYIEDNPLNIELVEQILTIQRFGIKLLSDANGMLAVDLAIEHQPDIILLDLNLPDLHGSEVLKLLQTDKRTKAIPVVIISADAMLQQINELLNAGASRFLTKPIDVNAFLKVVDEFITS